MTDNRRVEQEEVNMKTKKILALLLAAVMMMGVLAACGGNSNAGNTAATGSNAAASAADTTAEPDDELAAIQKAGVLKVGVEGTYPPFTYHDDAGNLIGYDVEVATAIAEKLGVKAEFTESDWDSLLAAVDSGRIDTVINDVTVTEERAEKYDFSTPYLYIPRQACVAGDNEDIKSEADIAGKRCATAQTNAMVPDLEAKGVIIVPVDTSGQAADLVVQGRADFNLMSPTVLAPYLDAHPEANIKVAFEFEGEPAKDAVPVRKGETRLVEAINKALAELSEDGTLKALSEKYFRADYTTAH